MLQRIAVNLLGTYQRYVRMLLPQSCRFEPSCSEYAKQAFQKYGFLKGIGKAVKRLTNCHPFSSKAGYDPLL